MRGGMPPNGGVDPKAGVAPKGSVVSVGLLRCQLSGTTIACPTISRTFAASFFASSLVI